MNGLVPSKVFLTKGVGRHKYQLKSFEEALRKAGVAQQNLVQVSSILPPKCRIVSREHGLPLLSPGQISYCVMARADTNEHGRLVASSIGVAIPKDKSKWGYLSEVHGHGMNYVLRISRQISLNGQILNGDITLVQSSQLGRQVSDTDGV